MRRVFARHLPHETVVGRLKIGFGAALGIGFVAWLGEVTGEPLLIAPFGASAVLLFGVPSSPLAQPANVIGGHLIITALSLVLRGFLPDVWWAAALAMGLAMVVMVALRITHPPAGADPIVVFASNPGPEFLIVPILVGSVALVILAAMVHRLPPDRRAYPLPHAAARRREKAAPERAA